MADDVEALIAALALENAVVIGWSFGSFVAQSHMVRHGSAAAYVLMGTVAEPGALANVEHELAAFEPESLRAQVAASWALEATRRDAGAGAAAARRPDAVPRRRPDGPLVARARRRRPGRLPARGAAALRGGRGVRDARPRETSCARVTKPTLDPQRRPRPHDAGSVGARAGGDPAACEEIVFADSAHMVPYEQPDAFTAALPASSSATELRRRGEPPASHFLNLT